MRYHVVFGREKFVMPRAYALSCFMRYHLMHYRLVYCTPMRVDFELDETFPYPFLETDDLPEPRVGIATDEGRWRSRVQHGEVKRHDWC